MLAFSFFLCIDVLSHKMTFSKIFECTALRAKMKNALYRGLSYSLLTKFLCRTYPRYFFYSGIRLYYHAIIITIHLLLSSLANETMCLTLVHIQCVLYSLFITYIIEWSISGLPSTAEGKKGQSNSRSLRYCMWHLWEYASSAWPAEVNLSWHSKVSVTSARGC